MFSRNRLIERDPRNFHRFAGLQRTLPLSINHPAVHQHDPKHIPQSPSVYESPHAQSNSIKNFALRKSKINFSILAISDFTLVVDSTCHTAANHRSNGHSFSGRLIFDQQLGQQSIENVAVAIKNNRHLLTGRCGKQRSVVTKSASHFVTAFLTS